MPLAMSLDCYTVIYEEIYLDIGVERSCTVLPQIEMCLVLNARGKVMPIWYV